MSSATQIVRPKPTTYDISDIVRLATAGSVRVPHFQRSFVWDASDVLKLFDSIWRGFPIGTLLLWRHEAEGGQAKLGPLTIDVPYVSDALWVVDGQQRITSLVGALSGAVQGRDARFLVGFDLRRRRFVHLENKPSPHVLPVSVALETRQLLAWLRDHEPDLTVEDLDTADALGGVLRDYQIPAYIVDTSDETLLREVFDRVNEAGKRIGRAEIFHALFASSTEPGSPANVIEALHKQGFGELDPDRIVQSLLALRGGNIQRDIHLEFERNESTEEWYEQTEIALSRVISFFRRQGVPHIVLVPSTFPIPVLAAFYYLHPEPDPYTEQLLALWVWRGWAHGFGKGGQTPALRRAVRAVNPTKGHPEEALPEYEAVRILLDSVPDEPAPDILGSPFRTDTAAGRLCLLALASLRPRSRSGREIDLGIALDAEGIGAVTEIVPGNRGDAASRGFWPSHEKRPTGDEPSEILASHAIEAEASDALRRDERQQFLKRRRASLKELTSQYLAIRLQVGKVVRPPLSSFVVEDPSD